MSMNSSAAAGRGIKRKATTTALPNNPNEMPQEELVALVRSIANERDNLELELDEKSKKLNLAVSALCYYPSAKETVTAVAAGVTPPIAAALNEDDDEPTQEEIAAFRKRISTAVVRDIKMAAHNTKKKPWTEVFEGNTSPELIYAFMKDYYISSDTKRMTKWSFTEDDHIANVLGTDKLIHPVNFDGFVRNCPLTGRPPRMYAWAGYHSMEVKYEKSYGIVTFKVRTYLVEAKNLDYVDVFAHMF